ncbi:MAG TPA: hypothetical protein VGJ37_14745 [Pyrinomonadaceae bacterium]|jgi:hypothetical protein
MQQLTTRSWLSGRSWRKLKSVLHPLPPRARNDYATHVPVLIGLAASRRIERVLEFGCGHYSTKTFLNRAAFPDLRQLKSVENDRAWAETVRGAVGYDERCVLNVVSGAMCDAVSRFDLESFDLVLVDDSKTAPERVATLRTISLAKPQGPWIVIHDYEIDEYQRTAADFKHRFTFKAYNPHTGLVFNSTDTPDLKALDKRIRVNSARIELDDVEGWLRVLRK